jgi:putrescine transport system substrate-binding protein
VFQARDRASEANAGVEVGYSVPSQGAQIFFDVFGIPADAPHVAEAHEFINYMMKPEVDRQGLELRVLRQRQQGVAAASRQGSDRRYGDLSDAGGHGETLHRSATRCKSAALVTRLWTTVVTGQ